MAGPAPPKARPCSVAHWMQGRVVLFHVATGVPDKYYRKKAVGTEVEESRAHLAKTHKEFEAAGIPAEAEMAFGDTPKRLSDESSRTAVTWWP